ncbi:MAG TPA: hypothetical protein V6D05_11450 [Stenomitos sp.]
MNQTEAEEQMLSYARRNIALEARLLSVEYEPDTQIWLGTVSTRSGTLRLLAEQRDGQWSVWRYQGALPKPKPRPF